MSLEFRDKEKFKHIGDEKHSSKRSSRMFVFSFKREEPLLYNVKIIYFSLFSFIQQLIPIHSSDWSGNVPRVFIFTLTALGQKLSVVSE